MLRMSEDVFHDPKDGLRPVDGAGVLVNEFLQFMSDGTSWWNLDQALSLHWEIFDGGAVL